MFAERRHFQATLHMPLRQLAICMDCDECFDLAIGACPACSGTAWAPLARFLGSGVCDVVSRAVVFHGPAPRGQLS